MLQIALAQEKTGNTSENLVNKLAKLFIHCIQHNKSLKKYMIIQNGWYIHEFKK